MHQPIHQVFFWDYRRQFTQMSRVGSTRRLPTQVVRILSCRLEVIWCQSCNRAALSCRVDCTVPRNRGHEPCRVWITLNTKHGSSCLLFGSCRIEMWLNTTLVVSCLRLSQARAEIIWHGHERGVSHIPFLSTSYLRTEFCTLKARHDTVVSRTCQADQNRYSRLYSALFGLYSWI